MEHVPDRVAAENRVSVPVERAADHLDVVTAVIARSRRCLARKINVRREDKAVLRAREDGALQLADVFELRSRCDLIRLRLRAPAARKQRVLRRLCKQRARDALVPLRREGEHIGAALRRRERRARDRGSGAAVLAVCDAHGLPAGRGISERDFFADEHF